MTEAPDTTPPTFCDLFRLNPHDLAACLDDPTILRSTQEGKRLAKWMSATPAHPVREELAQHMCDAITDPLVSVFAGAWSKYSELKTCANETRQDPKSSMDIALADHDFTYQINSSVDILLNGSQVASVPFSFAATCTVSGLELALKNGCVVAVRAGKLACSAEILCASSSVWTRTLPSVNLPGELHFAKPIPLDAP
jgi:hypothetical protein